MFVTSNVSDGTPLGVVLPLLTLALTFVPLILATRLLGPLRSRSVLSFQIVRFLRVIDSANWALQHGAQGAHRKRLAVEVATVAKRFPTYFPVPLGRGSRTRTLRAIARRCAEDLQSYVDVALVGDLEELAALRDDWIRYDLRIVLGSWTEVHRPGTTFEGLRTGRIDWNRSLGSPAFGAIIPALATAVSVIGILLKK